VLYGGVTDMHEQTKDKSTGQRKTVEPWVVDGACHDESRLGGPRKIGLVEGFAGVKRERKALDSSQAACPLSSLCHFFNHPSRTLSFRPPLRSDPCSKETFCFPDQDPWPRSSTLCIRSP
jgi:hypothetical protein